MLMHTHVKRFATNVGNFCYRETADIAANVSRDFKSMRALWNWLFLVLYGWVVIYLTRHQGAICGNTIVVTTGSIVTAIFTNYVWSSYMEKKNRLTPVIIPPTPPTPGDENEPTAD